MIPIPNTSCITPIPPFSLLFCIPPSAFRLPRLNKKPHILAIKNVWLYSHQETDLFTAEFGFSKRDSVTVTPPSGHMGIVRTNTLE